MTGELLQRAAAAPRRTCACHCGGKGGRERAGWQSEGLARLSVHVSGGPRALALRTSGLRAPSDTIFADCSIAGPRTGQPGHSLRSLFGRRKPSAHTCTALCGLQRTASCTAYCHSACGVHHTVPVDAGAGCFRGCCTTSLNVFSGHEVQLSVRHGSSFAWSAKWLRSGSTTQNVSTGQSRRTQRAEGT